MYSKGAPPTSRTAAFELLPREPSLDLRHGSAVIHSGADDDHDAIHYRPRRHSGYEQRDRRPEIQNRRSFAKRFGLSSDLEAALELVTQSTPSLLCAVVGSVMMGVVFDKVQFWPAFVKIEELFILVPVLLNLKGCLEMNLASRLSTSVCVLSIFSNCRPI
jgi:hypothetical protein